MIPRVRLKGQNTEGDGRKKYFPCFSPCPPLLPSFQVVFMLAAAINVPLGHAFVNRPGEMQSFRWTFLLLHQLEFFST